MPLTVINGEVHGFRGEGVIYIGLDYPHLGLSLHPLACPFEIGPDGDRQTVIAKYKKWLWEAIQQKKAAYYMLLDLAQRSQKEDLKLACFCKPADCHGDVIVAAIDWLNKQPTIPQ